MIAREAESASRTHHGTNDVVRIQDPRTAINDVAQEDGTPPSGMTVRGRAIRALVAQLRQKDLQLVGTPVNVADDVERPTLVPAVGPEPNALDLDAFGSGPTYGCTGS